MTPDDEDSAGPPRAADPAGQLLPDATLRQVLAAQVGKLKTDTDLRGMGQMQGIIGNVVASQLRTAAVVNPFNVALASIVRPDPAGLIRHQAALAGILAHPVGIPALPGINQIFSQFVATKDPSAIEKLSADLGRLVPKVALPELEGFRSLALSAAPHKVGVDLGAFVGSIEAMLPKFDFADAGRAHGIALLEWATSLDVGEGVVSDDDIEQLDQDQTRARLREHLDGVLAWLYAAGLKVQAGANRAGVMADSVNEEVERYSTLAKNIVFIYAMLVVIRSHV
ncbi:hypothetical protein BH10ACT8_BH10ACT8_11180 [soil metagenome]